MAVPTYSADKLLCGRDEVNHVLSENGFNDALDDARIGEPKAFDVNAIFERGTADIRLRLSARYDDATLKASVWVKWAAAILCAYKVCMRKGLTPPPGFALEVDQLLKDLLAIQTGSIALPDGAPERITAMPTMSNVGINSRYNNAKIRVDTVTSPSYGARDVQPRADVPSIDFYQ